jgi:hypothetical protein
LKLEVRAPPAPSRSVYGHAISTRNRECKSAAVLPLLAEDKSLAKYVVELTLSRHITYDLANDLQNLPCLVNVSALANIVSPKRIRLSDCVFRSGVEHAQALAGISLKRFTFVVMNDSLEINLRVLAI